MRSFLSFLAVCLLAFTAACSGALPTQPSGATANDGEEESPYCYQSPAGTTCTLYEDPINYWWSGCPAGPAGGSDQTQTWAVQNCTTWHNTRP